MSLTLFSPWLLVQATTGLAIAYTSPHETHLRFAAVVTIIALSIAMQIDSLVPGRKMHIVGPFVAMGWVNVLNGIDLLLLSRASYTAQAEWEAKNRISSADASPVTTRLSWAFWMPYNYRRVRTPWQIKRLPGFSRRDPAYIPSRANFLLRCAAKVAVCAAFIPIFTIDLQYPGLKEQLAILWGDDSGQLGIPLAPRLLVQSNFMLMFGILTRAVIVGVYSSLALVCVALDVTEPALWPPISGSLMDAWSIQRLWGYARLILTFSPSSVELKLTEVD